MNLALFHWLFSFSHRSLLWDDVGIFLASYLPYLLMLWLVILFVSLKNRRRRVAFFAEIALAIIIGRGVITQLIYFFHPTLPPFAVLNFAPLVSSSGSSFPAQVTVILASCIIAVGALRLSEGFWFGVLVVLNGVALVYAGAQWPGDILGGLVIGLLVGIGVHLLLKPSLDRLTGVEKVR